MIFFALLLLRTLLDELSELLGSLLGGRDVLLVLPQGVATYAARECLDGSHVEARADLNKHELVDVIILRELLLILVENLIVSEVDGTVDPVERDHVVHERLTLRMIFGRVEHMRQHFFCELELRLRLIIEVRIERHEGARVLQVVA